MLITPAEPQIVQASPEDADKMRALRGDNWREYVADASDEVQAWMEDEVAQHCGPEGVAIEADRIRQSLEPQSVWFCRVARVDNRFVGYLSGRREHRDAAEFAGFQEVAALHVDQRRGRGIGSRLLASFFEEVGDDRPTSLQVVEGVPAVGFYAKHGFEERQKARWGPLWLVTMVRGAEV